MRFLTPFVALVWLLPVGASAAGEPVFKTNEVPKTSELRKDVSFDIAAKDLRDKILKLIPLGTSEADAKVLFQKHMPPKARKRFNEPDAGVALPENLRGKPYTCYRLLGEFHPRKLGSRSIEVGFFFDNGKLMEIHVLWLSVVL
jgi:hypothetical protein